MGNSCTRAENQVVLSERGTRHPDASRKDPRDRGRWSAPDVVESVDLDTLLEAPSPPPQRRHTRGKSKSERSSRFHWTAGENQPIDLDTVIEADSSFNGSKKTAPSRTNPRKVRGRTEFRQQQSGKEDEGVVYHSYDDPGYMGTDHNIELTHFDSDLILGSPLNSPSMIHARWGEPVDDPDEESVCTEYRANPFKLGFCVNCQKQHDVTTEGAVVSEKNYKKITRPATSKTAANALDNPAAVENAPVPKRESDVDLAALLRQRRDILLKLNKLDQEKAKTNAALIASRKSTIDPPTRHTMFLSETGNPTSLANLRRMTSNGRIGAPPAPQSYVLNRGTSVVLSPRATSLRGISKSISFGGSSHLVDDEEPSQNDWL